MDVTQPDKLTKATLLLMNLTFQRIGGPAILGALLFGLVSAGGDEPARQTGLLFEGHFERADIASRINGARKTQLAAAYTWKYGVRLFTDQTWEESGIQWDEFSTRAARLADRIAQELEPEYVRDHRGVIDYAIVSEKNPFLSSSITSPLFVEPFLETLGDKLHVVIIDRHVLYVFPATGGRLAEFGPALVRIYRQTPLPVSLEIFEVEKEGYRVIGEIEGAR